MALVPVSNAWGIILSKHRVKKKLRMRFIIVSISDKMPQGNLFLEMAEPLDL